MEDNKDNTIEYIEKFLDEDYVSLKTNLETLLKDNKRKSKRLDKILLRSDKQQRQLMSLNHELDSHKKNLEIKVEEEIQKRQEKEKMLLQQSKLASMGEMMDAVAHQWKQPIGIMSLQVEMLGYDFEDKLVDENYVKDFQAQLNHQIAHMTSTLSEFRSFFRPSKELEEFDVKEMIDKVLLLVKDEFMQYNIEIVVDDSQEFKLIGIENEFKHLIINIINNSKDAFLENNIENKKILINIVNNEEIEGLEIIDNAGGIPEHVIADIFKANVTTKEDGKGTGIGLYMSSQIAQKHNGTLSVVNVNKGAKFMFYRGK